MSDSHAQTTAELIETKGKWRSFIKLYLTVLVIVIICEIIWINKIKVGPGSIVLLPMLYAVIVGILITPNVLGKVIRPLRKLIGSKEVEIAGPLVMISLLPLGVKYGTLVGPNIVKIVTA